MLSRVKATTVIEINISDKTLRLIQNSKAHFTFPVAVGKAATPTPTGSYKVINKKIWPGGPFGSRWLGLNINSKGSYGIHGTNNPSSIGKAVSNGCIRMHNQHVESIFPYVFVGTPVVILRSSNQPAKKNNDGQISPTSIVLSNNPDHPKQLYYVKNGDSLWEIAQRFGLDITEILQINPDIVDADQLDPGQIINIPV